MAHGFILPVLYLGQSTAPLFPRTDTTQDCSLTTLRGSHGGPGGLRQQMVDIETRSPKKGGDRITYDLGAGPVTKRLAGMIEVSGALRLSDGQSLSRDFSVLGDETGALFLALWDPEMLDGREAERLDVTEARPRDASALRRSAREDVKYVNCFRSDTMVRTPEGERRIATLRRTDLVETVFGEAVAVRWIGTTTLSPTRLARLPNLAPLRIAAGAFGDGMPDHDLYVSQQHRLLIGGNMVERVTGEQSVLVAAKHLSELPGIDDGAAPEGISYTHLMCDRHEVIWANGMPAETLYLGDQAKSALPAALRAEVSRLFPELFTSGARPIPAYPFLKSRKATELLLRLERRRERGEAGGGLRLAPSLRQ